jgi:hypothetical protein
LYGVPPLTDFGQSAQKRACSAAAGPSGVVPSAVSRAVFLSIGEADKEKSFLIDSVG